MPPKGESALPLRRGGTHSRRDFTFPERLELPSFGSVEAAATAHRHGSSDLSLALRLLEIDDGVDVGAVQHDRIQQLRRAGSDVMDRVGVPADLDDGGDRLAVAGVELAHT